MSKIYEFLGPIVTAGQYRPDLPNEPLPPGCTPSHVPHKDPRPYCTMDDKGRYERPNPGEWVVEDVLGLRVVQDADFKKHFAEIAEPVDGADDEGGAGHGA